MKIEIINHHIQSVSLTVNSKLHTLTASMQFIPGSVTDPELDFVERVHRRVELHSISHELGYGQPNTRTELSTLLNFLKNYTPQPKKRTL